METRASKRKRLLLEKQIEEMERMIDRITNLPDAIVHHILSFLPIEIIAQTGVLSKRWAYLWSSYPFLDFSTICKNRVNHGNHGNPMDSMINSILAHRQEDSNIKLFRLKSSVSSLTLFLALGNLVSLHKIEELDLDVPLRDHFDIPVSLLSCKSLRALTLKSGDTDFYFNFSTHWFMGSSGLKSLHTLSLTCVYFVDSPSLIQKLFSNSTFPILRKLYLRNCKGVASLNISCQMLEKLELYDLNLEGLGIFCTRLEVLKVISCFTSSLIVQRWVHVVAPQLRALFWEYNVIPEKCSMEGFTYITSGAVHFLPDLPNEVPLRSAATLLSVLSFTKRLFLGPLLISVQFSSHFNALKYCLYQDKELLLNFCYYKSKSKQLVAELKLLAKIDFAGERLRIFENLRTLAFHTGLNKYELPGIACKLRCCPRLRQLTVVIYNDMKNGQDIWNREDLDSVNMTEGEYWVSQSQPLQSMLQHLYIVNIDVRGSVIFESTLNLTKFLLGYGRVLKQMKLMTSSVTSPNGSSLWQRRIAQRTEEFRAASPDLILHT